MCESFSIVFVRRTGYHLPAMTSQLPSSASRRRRTPKAIALGVTVALHGLIIAFALTVRTSLHDEPKAEPIQVTMLTEATLEPPAPAMIVSLQEPSVPALAPPAVNIDYMDEPLPAAITVSAPSVPMTDLALAGDTGLPIIATTVEYVRRPAVVYPPAAKRARATGTVFVRALVETDGHVREAKVDRSSGYALLDRAACESVLAALFKPYVRDGVARAALVIVPIDFALTLRTASR
jgi:periplasmic protein TonB